MATDLPERDDLEDGLLSVPASAQDHRQGALNAPVVLVMYGDYQSTQSANVYRLIKAMQQQLMASLGEAYLCFVFRHFPQMQAHVHAQRAAEAAEAAATQGQFWQMHDALFTHSQALGDGYLVEYANNLGLNIPQFLRDISTQTHLDQINQDIESGLQSGVTAAPALFINSVQYTDIWGFDRLISAVFAAGH